MNQWTVYYNNLFMQMGMYFWGHHLPFLFYQQNCLLYLDPLNFGFLLHIGICPYWCCAHIFTLCLPSLFFTPPLSMAFLWWLRIFTPPLPMAFLWWIRIFSHQSQIWTLKFIMKILPPFFFVHIDYLSNYQMKRCFTRLMINIWYSSNLDH